MDILPEESYLRFNPDGSSHFVTMQSSPRKVTEKIMEKFTKNISLNLKRAFPCEETGGTASIICTNTERYAVARLKVIKLNCHFRLVGDKVLVPVFVGKETSREGYIAAAPEWTVPDDMILLFAARIYNFNDVGRPLATNPDHSCYLIAYDKDKRSYRLPISNVYDDCAICMGKFNGDADTASEALSLAMRQFNASDWNADLSGETTNSDSLFRFKTKDELTECLPPAYPWPKLCKVVSTPITQLIGGLL